MFQERMKLKLLSKWHEITKTGNTDFYLTFFLHQFHGEILPLLISFLYFSQFIMFSGAKFRAQLNIKEHLLLKLINLFYFHSLDYSDEHETGSELCHLL